MATIIRRGDLQYQAKIRMAGYPVISKTFPNKSLAERWATVTESEMIRGEFIPKRAIEQVTLAKALDRYAKEISIGKKGEKQEVVRIKRLQQHRLAKKPMAAITPEDIEEYVGERRSDQSQRTPEMPVSEATIRLEVMLLSAVFKTAMSKKWNYCRTNPVREIDQASKPGKSKERTRRLVGNEEQRLLAALDLKCRNRDIPLVVRLALQTGARQSELIGMPATKTSTRPARPGLTWADVDLVNRAIVLRDTKNGRDRRVPLNNAAHDLLASLPRPIHGGKVFNVTQDGIIRAMQSACREAEIGDLTFHDLRHEATSRLVEAGLSMIEVQSITGHSSADMVRRYNHIDTLKLSRKLG